MAVKCIVCGAEIEEDEAMKDGEAIFCEDCWFEKNKRRC